MREADGAVERDPAHDARVGEVLLAAAHFPDAFVGLLPFLADKLDEARELHPEIAGDRRSAFVVKIDGVHELAVDIELELAGGAIADADGRGFPVALEMRERALGQIVRAIERMHELKRTIWLDLVTALFDPAHKGRGLGGVT